MLGTAPSVAGPAAALSKNLKKAPGGQYGAVSLVTLAPKSTPGKVHSPGSRDLKGSPSSGQQATEPSPTGSHAQTPYHTDAHGRDPLCSPVPPSPISGPLPSPHHGAGPPEQQGHQVAVLAQQAERGVHGVAPLPLEGDEDGSARELQQPAQALPAGAGPLGRTRQAAHPTPRGTHRKLWLHQARPRKASDSTTMRRRQRLRFTRRSAEGSAGTGRRRGRGEAGRGRGQNGAGPWEGGARSRDGGGARAQNGAGSGARWGGALRGARGTRARQEIAVVQAQLVASTPL